MATIVNRNKAGERRRSHPVKKFLKITFLLFVTVLFVSIGTVFGVFWKYLDKAQDGIDKLDSLLDQFDSKPSQIVDRNGTVLYEYRADRHEVVKLKDIPKVMKDAIIAAEDKRFYTHHGIDYVSAARQVFTNSKAHRIAGGASTISMQLAKLVTSDSEKTLDRKLSDMAYAIELEKRYSKDKILEIYLNKVYFGRHAFGVKAASRVYFNKDLTQIDLSEAATLARCVRRPSDENPIDDIDAAKHNRDVVLSEMLDEGMINEAQYEKAKNEELHVNSAAANRSVIKGAPYYVNHVLDVLRRHYPDVFENFKQGGWRIETTLDLNLQQVAEEKTRKIIAQNRRGGVTTAAAVLMNRFGEVLAEVGGADFERTQWNAIYQGQRQPGSSFKAFVYATGFAKGEITLDSTLSNERRVYKLSGGEEYEPSNAEGDSYGGQMAVRKAFASSYNLPAIDLINKVGPSEVVRYCKDVFGFQSNLGPYLSLALGSSAVSPLEMAQGYSVFMLKGDRATPFVIKRIVQPDGQIKGEYEPRIVTGVLDSVVCDQMDELMKGVVQYGTGTAAQIVPNARGKTGTTDDHRDVWFCGYANGLVCVVWAANEKFVGPSRAPKYQQMGPHVWGATISAPLWAQIMKSAYDRYGEKFSLSGPPVLPADQAAKQQAPQSDVPSVAPEPAKSRDKNDENSDSQTAVAEPKQKDQGGDTSTSTDEPQTKDGTSDATKPDSGTDTGDAPPPPKPKPRRKDPATQDDTVSVLICVKSGRLATMYCPETINRRYPRGSAPTLHCTIHN